MLKKLADIRPVVVTRETTVLDAVRAMAEHKHGSAIILDDERPAGIFTERDVMSKVVACGLDPSTTPVSKVMTAPVLAVESKYNPRRALEVMLERHIRHLAVVDDDGKIIGVLSIRHLLRNEVEALRSSVEGLEAYLGYDGPGG